MALYNVMFLCSDCGRFHATKLSITVIDGPDRRKQIEEVYSPSATPPEVTELLRTHIRCPVTRNSIKLDRKELYLVPIELNIIHAVFQTDAGPRCCTHGDSFELATKIAYGSDRESQQRQYGLRYGSSGSHTSWGDTLLARARLLTEE